MITWLLKKIIGSKNTRLVKSLRPVVERINALEEEFRALSDEALKELVWSWRMRFKVAPIDEHRAILDEILPNAFAAVKNTARRLAERKHEYSVCDQPVTWNMVHYDVQLIGGICLHRGMIAEMATGEGKTLVATLPLFLNALPG